MAKKDIKETNSAKEEIEDESEHTSDEERGFFMERALLSHCEVVYAIDGWLRSVDAHELKVPLSDEGVKALADALNRLRRRVMYPGLKTLECVAGEPLRTYLLDIFDDCIQLGLMTYPDGTHFDGNGWAEDFEDNDYSLIYRIPVRTMTVEQWAKLYDVKPGTVRQWISRNRITYHKDMNGVRISAIQYVPDSVTYDINSFLRYKFPGKLPESVLEKYPYFDGELLDIWIFPPEYGARRLVTVRAGSETTTDEDGNTVRKAETQTVYLGEDVCADVIKCLREAGCLNQKENVFTSPLPEAISGGRHFAKISLSGDESKVLHELNVGGKIFSEDIFGQEAPTFTLTFRNSDQDDEQCAISGTLFRRWYTTFEEKIIQSFFGNDNVIEAKNRIAQIEGVDFSKCYEWDRKMLFIHTLDISDNARDEDVALFLKSAMASAIRAFSFEATIAVFALDLYDCDMAYVKRIDRLMAMAGYRSVGNELNDPDEFEGIRVFYAYSQEPTL